MLCQVAAAAFIDLEEWGQWGEFTNNVLRLEVRKPLVYAVAHGSGVYAIDVTDAHSPQEMAHRPTSQLATGLALTEESVFVSVDRRTLLDPSLLILADNPVDGLPLISGLTNMSWILGLASSGSQLFMAVGRDLLVYDVSNPATPLQIGSVHFDLAAGISMLGALALNTNDQIAYYAIDKSVFVVDVADPAHMMTLGQYTFSGYWATFDMVEKDRLLYLGAGGPSLVILDATDPTHITEAGRFASDRLCFGLDLQADLAYLAQGDQGLAVVDVSDATNVSLVNQYETERETYDVRVAGHEVFLSYANQARPGTNGCAISILGFAPRLEVTSMAEGLVQATLWSLGSGTAILEASVSLHDWEPIGTNHVSSYRLPLSWAQPDVPAQQFYRVRFD